MNFFYLDKDPFKSIKYHCDKHIVKIATEYKQMLCTAHRVLDGEMFYDKTARGHKIKRWKLADRKMNKHLYLAGHVNHPTNIWLRECASNYMLMFTYYQLICKEYTYRYGKEHGAKDYWWLLRNPPMNINKTKSQTPVPQAMQEFPQCKVDGDSVQAYRNFYKVAKRRFATWKNRPIPTWFMTQSQNDTMIGCYGNLDKKKHLKEVA